MKFTLAHKCALKICQTYYETHVKKFVKWTFLLQKDMFKKQFFESHLQIVLFTPVYQFVVNLWI